MEIITEKQKIFIVDFINEILPEHTNIKEILEF